MKGPVFLVGLMGSGKTTVGRLLARELSRPWMDLDREVEKRAGLPVAGIFRRQGEAAFRRQEGEALRRAAKSRAVVSCGGGVVLAPANKRLLKKAVTVYLCASPEILAGRLRGPEARKRPLLKGQSALAALTRLQSQRARHYRACAKIVLLAHAKPALLVKRLLLRLKHLS